MRQRHQYGVLRGKSRFRPGMPELLLRQPERAAVRRPVRHQPNAGLPELLYGLPERLGMPAARAVRRRSGYSRLLRGNPDLSGMRYGSKVLLLGAGKVLSA